jgi:retron-type reverse transcriptase
MAKRHIDLYRRIASFAALRAAAATAILGKRRKPGAASFMANVERELLRLEQELREGRYRPGRYVEIEVWDPKHRIVSAAPFRDRVVHHALCAVVAPIFEAGFISNTFANRTGRGSHAAIAAYEHYRNGHAHVLRCDIYRYFPAIDHAILKAEFRRRIGCPDTLWLMDTIVDGSNAQEPVDLHFPGDDLFAPFQRRRGLPIGNLTSQFAANLYLDRFDHFVTEVLRAPYVRYVDDFALFQDNLTTLAEWRTRIARYLEGRRLKLHPRKTVILPTSEPTVFLGYELAPRVSSAGRRPHDRAGLRRLPEANVARFRGRLRGMRDQLAAGTITPADATARVSAWAAHAEHADTWRLRRAILGEAGAQHQKPPPIP